MTQPINHYPLFGRKAPKSCADGSGTANPFAPITCPCCRARLAKQIASKRAGAMSYAADSQERPFFLANAAHFQRLLDGELVA